MYDDFYNMDQYYSVRQEVSYARVLHAAPDAPPVDVYVNDRLIVRGLAYRGFTEYLPLVPGRYVIAVFPAGQTVNPVIRTAVDVPGKSVFTMAAVGTLSNISLFPVPEPIIPKVPGQTYLRFVHLSPNAPNVDVALRNGAVLFKDVSYLEVENYLQINPSKYDFEIRLAGTNQVVLQVPNIRLKPNRFYTIYAVGLAGGRPPLQVLIPLDGVSYLNV